MPILLASAIGTSQRDQHNYWSGLLFFSQFYQLDGIIMTYQNFKTLGIILLFILVRCESSFNFNAYKFALHVHYMPAIKSYRLFLLQNISAGSISSLGSDQTSTVTLYSGVDVPALCTGAPAEGTSLTPADMIVSSSPASAAAGILLSDGGSGPSSDVGYASITSDNLMTEGSICAESNNSR